MIYEFHFRLVKSTSSGAPFRDWIVTPLVRHEELSTFKEAIMSDI